MTVELVGWFEVAGFSLLQLGIVAAAYMRVHVLTVGDVLLRLRHIRLGTVVAVLRRAWPRRQDGLCCRGADIAPRTPAPDPVTRAVRPHGDAPRVVGSAVTGNPGPVVVPAQRAAATGPAPMSAPRADGASPQGSSC